MFSRMALMKFHVLLAVCILPVATMFFVTGALYTWGIKGDYEVKVYTLELQQPLQKQVGYLVDIVKDELKRKSLSLPTGKAKIKTIGSSFKLEWTGSNKDIILQASANPLIAQLKVKETGWHRLFVQLHKAKGGVLFKIYATLLAIALLFLFVTGFIMAWQLPKLRNMVLTSSTFGLVLFAIVVFLS